jgi:ATP-dependent protease ClpP protease subunit
MHLTTPRRLLVGSLGCVLLAGVCGARAVSVERAWRASAMNASRWFKFDCGKEQAAPCVLTVRLRGPIDGSHLRLFEEAVRWRDGAQRALDRRIELHVDANTRGGELFAAMEIGRLLRRESAALHVSRSAECSSACVFVLMGATARSVAPGGRVGIHRPSLETAGSEELVGSMEQQLVGYAEGMNVPRRIVDDMMATPSRQLRYLTPAELSGWVVVSAEQPR